MLKLTTTILLTLLSLIAYGQISFSDQTSLLSEPIFNSGVAIGVVDMNGDGLDDIVRYNQGRDLNIEYQNAPNSLFSNYNFGNVHTSSEWSTCVADIDGNGYNDILVGGAYDDVKILTANNDGTALTQ